MYEKFYLCTYFCTFATPRRRQDMRKVKNYDRERDMVWCREKKILILWSSLRVHIMAIKYWKKLLLFGFCYASLLCIWVHYVRLSEFVVVANKQFISRCWNLMALGGIAIANVPLFSYRKKIKHFTSII